MICVGGSIKKTCLSSIKNSYSHIYQKCHIEYSVDNKRPSTYRTMAETNYFLIFMVVTLHFRVWYIYQEVVVRHRKKIKQQAQSIFQFCCYNSLSVMSITTLRWLARPRQKWQDMGNTWCGEDCSNCCCFLPHTQQVSLNFASTNWQI